jgi:ABC-type sulfate/molybdate transport systems ATPase subunit
VFCNPVDVVLAIATEIAVEFNRMKLIANCTIAYANGVRIEYESSTPLTAKSTCILGASGSGKSSFLRCLAGVQTPNRGTIAFDDQVWFDSSTKVNLAPQSRSIAYLQQGQPLFPHRDVRGNLELAAKALAIADRSNSIQRTIDRFEIGPLLSHHVHELSGGQRQRVALAQSLIRNPKLVLLDEPFQSLDTHLQAETRAQLKEHLRDIECQVIFVTHNAADAKALADEVIVLAESKMFYHGTLDDSLRCDMSQVARLIR